MNIIMLDLVLEIDPSLMRECVVVEELSNIDHYVILSEDSTVTTV